MKIQSCRQARNLSAAFYFDGRLLFPWNPVHMQSFTETDRYCVKIEMEKDKRLLSYSKLCIYGNGER